MEAVKQAFPPEFINRLDEVIVFHPLKQQHIRKIAENMTAKLVERMRKQGVRLIIEDSAIDLLAEKGYDAAYGARPLRRTIQTMLEDPLADCLLEKDPAADCVITAAAEEQEIRLRIDCSAQV